MKWASIWWKQNDKGIGLEHAQSVKNDLNVNFIYYRAASSFEIF